MLGIIINSCAVIAGGAIGILLQKGVSPRIQTALFQLIGVITIAMGIEMVCEMENLIIIVGGLIVGTWLGTWWNLDKQTERLGEWLKRKIRSNNQRFTEGLVTAFLLFCIGPMTILGGIQEGLGVSRDLILTKSILDFISSIIFASTFGIGVIFSVIPLFIIEAALVLGAASASDFFSPTIISGITVTGGIMLLALGINMLEIKKISVANMLPSLVVVIFALWLMENFM